GHALQHTGIDVPERAGDADQLFARRGQRGRGLAFAGAMVEGARRREPERAGLYTGRGDATHLGDLVCGRRFAVGAPLPHHEQAQRSVTHLRGEVDVVRTALERVEIVRDAVPVPRQAFV